MNTIRNLAVTLGALMMMVAGCTTMDGQLQTDDLQVTEVQTSPNLYLNKAIAMEGEVKEILTTRSFVLDGAEPGMLVLLADDADIRIPITEGRLVQVAGKAQYMEQIKVDPDWAIENVMFKDYRDQPVFVATIVQNAD